MSLWFLLSIITYVLYIFVLYGNDKENTSNIDKYFYVGFVFNSIMFLILMYITLLSKNDRDKYIKHWKEIKEMEKRA